MEAHYSVNKIIGKENWGESLNLRNMAIDLMVYPLSANVKMDIRGLNNLFCEEKDF